MTIKEAGLGLRSALLSYYDIREASAITDLVLEDISGFNRVDRIIQDKTLLQDDQIRQLRCYIKYLNRKMPVQYVLGYSYFSGLKLKVNNQVLIPRPETEELVDWVTETLKGTTLDENRLLDMGTGSGCIPLAIKNKNHGVTISGCDISDGALGVARHNARLTGLDVSFFNMDILRATIADLAHLGELDYIVSNPPYIDLSEKPEMEDHVLEYEPHEALFADASMEATVFYQRISVLASNKLRAGGYVFLEINPIYVKEIVQMLRDAGFEQIEVRKDLQGKERMVKCLLKI